MRGFGERLFGDAGDFVEGKIELVQMKQSFEGHRRNIPDRIPRKVKVLQRRQRSEQRKLKKGRGGRERRQGKEAGRGGR